jgi:hypothetical protein
MQEERSIAAMNKKQMQTRRALKVGSRFRIEQSRAARNERNRIPK